MKAQTLAYPLEDDLVAALTASLLRRSSPWGRASIVREFAYTSGRTDVVAVAKSGEVLAFEAKLTRWREALHQAYRGRSFAHRCYVVLPTGAAERAAEYHLEFRRRQVGLCAIDHRGRLRVMLEVAGEEPLQPWLTALATTAAAAARSASTQCRAMIQSESPA